MAREWGPLQTFNPEPQESLSWLVTPESERRTPGPSCDCQPGPSVL